MRIRIATTLCLGLLATAQASAAEGFFQPAIVAGGSVGQLSVEDDGYLSPTGLVGFSTTGTAWMAYVGFEVNKYLSTEIGRFSGGTQSQETLIASPLPAFVSDVSKFKNDGWVISGIGAFPINEIVSVYGRAGIYRWKTRTRVTRIDEFVDPVQFTATPSVIRFTTTTYTNWQSATLTGNDPYLGLGVGINIDSGQIRLEYAMTKVDDADLRYISLLASWKFRLFN